MNQNQTLHIIRLRPDYKKMILWAGCQKLLDPQNEDFGYPIHALLAAAFGSDYPKPFRFLEKEDGSCELLAYAQRSPLFQESNLDALEALGLHSLEVKEMPMIWKTQDMLSFQIRVCPTIRQDKNGDRNKSCERDSYLASLEKHPPFLSRSEVYINWLKEKLSPVATLESATLSFFRLSSLSRRSKSNTSTKARKLTSFTLPDANICGTLTIQDPQGFHELLAIGIGRHKAFGFGMLLLKPVS